MKASPVFTTRTFLISLLLLLSSLHSFAQRQKELSPNPNYKELVSHADLVYDKPVNRSEEGMPLGNGRMGSLVWTTPSAIRFQLNRVDVFANNSASNNFYERHTDYCSGLGFVDVDFLSEEIFTDKKFQQHLSCYDGLMNVQGNAINARCSPGMNKMLWPCR